MTKNENITLALVGFGKNTNVTHNPSVPFSGEQYDHNNL